MLRTALLHNRSNARLFASQQCRPDGFEDNDAVTMNLDVDFDCGYGYGYGFVERRSNGAGDVVVAVVGSDGGGDAPSPPPPPRPIESKGCCDYHARETETASYDDASLDD